METCWCDEAKRMEGWSGSNGVRGTVGIHRPGRSVWRGGQSPQAQDVKQGPPHENSHKKHKVRSLDGKNRTLHEKQCGGSRDGAREYAEVHVCRRAGSPKLSSTTKRTVPPLLLVHCRRMLPVDAQPKTPFPKPNAGRRNRKHRERGSEEILDSCDGHRLPDRSEERRPVVVPPFRIRRGMSAWNALESMAVAGRA